MREIKFRAWEEKTKTMIPWGSMRQTAFNDLSVAQAQSLAHPFRPFFYGMFENPEITMMQYTGLKDKNGKEIYEGDIVGAAMSYVNGVVVWESHGACFNVSGYYDQSADYPTMAFSEYQPFEVIGNIHQNPELIV